VHAQSGFRSDQSVGDGLRSKLTPKGFVVINGFAGKARCHRYVVAMAEAIRIIGIDPGLRRTGWGVVDSLGNSLRFVASGAICSDAKSDLASRLCQIHDGLAEVLHAHMPHEAAVESTFVNKDAT